MVEIGIEQNIRAPPIEVERKLREFDSEVALSTDSFRFEYGQCTQQRLGWGIKKSCGNEFPICNCFSEIILDDSAISHVWFTDHHIPQPYISDTRNPSSNS